MRVVELLTTLLLVSCGTDDREAPDTRRGIVTQGFLRTLQLEEFQLIAHRGSSIRAPENTLAAIRLAMNDRAQMIEVDVNTSKDGKLFLLHDHSFLRTTNIETMFPGKEKPADLNLNEIRQLDAGSWMGRQFANERVPSLDDVMEILEGSELPLVLDIKDATAESLNLFLKKSSGLNKVYIQSRNIELLRELKRLNPKTRVIFLGRGDLNPEFLKSLRNDGVATINWSHGDLTKEKVMETRSMGFVVFAYTVDRPDRVRALIEFGVDGILCNDPGRLAQEFLNSTERTIKVAHR